MNQNTNLEQSKIDYIGTLHLTSHAHAPPLLPVPTLKYDLRSIPNPPKALRSSSTGLSKRLREWLLANRDFTSLLERAVEEIRNAMEVAAEEIAERGDDSLEEEEVIEDGRKDTEDDDDEATEPEEADSERLILVSVGVYCERGQHRSVGFVEELVKRVDHKRWAVEIIHRDLGKDRGNSSKKRRNGGDKKGKGMGSHSEDELVE